MQAVFWKVKGVWSRGMWNTCKHPGPEETVAQEASETLSGGSPLMRVAACLSEHWVTEEAQSPVPRPRQPSMGLPHNFL